MAGIQARYGISALDLGHKEYAQDDELMVRGDDGRMYYKRTDGVIVAYADKDLSEDEVISNGCPYGHRRFGSSGKRIYRLPYD